MYTTKYLQKIFYLSIMKIITLKSNIKSNIISNKTIENKKAIDTFTPLAHKEWLNSIYNYNINNLKNLPVIDDIIIKLIKGYFNMYSKIREKKIKLRHIFKRKRRVSGNKFWVSKVEVKHTNDKITLNLYIYNKKNNFILKKLNNNLKEFYINKFNRLKDNFYIKNYQKKTPFLTIMNFYKRKNINLLNNLEKSSMYFNKQGNNIKDYISLYILKNIYTKYIKKILIKELNTFFYKQYILYNTFKYRNTYIIPLKKLISKIYKKKIIFNIVTLKNPSLSSDILTEIIAVKARNRNNKIFRVFEASLNKIRIPIYSKNLIDREKNKLTITNNTFIKDKIELKSNIDQTNELLHNMYNNYNSLDINTKVLKSLNNSKVTGIRLEAAGRLTRRFTAQRAIYKLRYKGTLKNINSSYKGLSSKMLRNTINSNIQHTKLKSKNRIGAFGIKGWISSK